MDFKEYIVQEHETLRLIKLVSLFKYRQGLTNYIHTVPYKSVRQGKRKEKETKKSKKELGSKFARGFQYVQQRTPSQHAQYQIHVIINSLVFSGFERPLALCCIP